MQLKKTTSSVPKRLHGGARGGFRSEKYMASGKARRNHTHALEIATFPLLVETKEGYGRGNRIGVLHLQSFLIFLSAERTLTRAYVSPTVCICAWTPWILFAVRCRYSSISLSTTTTSKIPGLINSRNANCGKSRRRSG